MHICYAESNDISSLKKYLLAYFFHDMNRYFYVDVSKTLLKSRLHPSPSNLCCYFVFGLYKFHIIYASIK
jgi:hypothetical protein